jgi:hypothetical protein
MAAGAGHFQVVRWTVENARCEWDEELPRRAAAANRLDILEWALYAD